MAQEDVGGPAGYARAHRARFVEELKEFIRFPTVSAHAEQEPSLRRCATWLARHLGEIGLDKTKVVPTSGHPLVYGEWRGRPRARTLLVYGHYDVQPADERWRSPPFAPEVRGENLHGRGASDDKGQLWAHLKAVESWLGATGVLPINVAVLIDGEEEVGSSSLLEWLKHHARELRADVAVISDMPMLGPDRPALTRSLRGHLSMDVDAWRPGTGLHSGNFGGAVPNPLQALCAIVGTLHGADGRVAVPGFYDDVRVPGAAERHTSRRAGPLDAELLKDAGIDKGAGERGFSLYERTTIRPAVTLTGCHGGYQGDGSKAVIPTRATAQLDVRLVPGQDPHRVARLVRDHVTRATPAGIRSRVRERFATKPVDVDVGHPAVGAALAAYARGFGVPPVLRRLGGSLPAAGCFHDDLRLPLLLMGFALPDDRIHGPDEKYHLPTFFKAIDTSIVLLAELERRLGRPGRASPAAQAEDPMAEVTP